MADMVNHPAHYTDGKIEVIEYIEDKKLGYCLGNAIKYISRAGKKDKSKEIEDLKKAAWYIARRIKELEGGDEKMTDNEIIKALECCKDSESCADCYECPYAECANTNGCLGELIADTINLINRQQTEIDILIRKKETLRDEIAEQQAEIERLKKGWKADVILTADAKAEARKEFAERLKAKAFTTSQNIVGKCWYEIDSELIDNLLEEMEREDNA